MQFTTESALARTISRPCPIFRRNPRPCGNLGGSADFSSIFQARNLYRGDEPNVLVAMNPAALQANLEDVPPNAVIIVDREAFTEANLKRAGYTSNPSPIIRSTNSGNTS